MNRVGSRFNVEKRFNTNRIEGVRRLEGFTIYGPRVIEDECTLVENSSKSDRCTLQEPFSTNIKVE